VISPASCIFSSAFAAASVTPVSVRINDRVAFETCLVNCVYGSVGSSFPLACAARSTGCRSLKVAAGLSAAISLCREIHTSGIFLFPPLHDSWSLRMSSSSDGRSLVRRCSCSYFRRVFLLSSLSALVEPFPCALI
jgi:hypothetical protein